MIALDLARLASEAGDVAEISTATKVASAIATGITQGAMIALVALGYTMVYGVLKLINFAHSEVFMMAAYVGLFLVTALGGQENPYLAGILGTLLAMASAALLGILIERAAYRPLRGRGKGALLRITPLVTALGTSVLLQNLAQALFTSRPKSYPSLLAGTVELPVIGRMATSRIMIVVVSVLVMVALEIIVKRTWFGKAMRALSVNIEAARLMGVRTGRVIATTFALGSSLAAVGAVLFCIDQSPVYPTMGMNIGTRAFVAAVLGGIGSITGAMLGGLLLGIVGELVKLTEFSGKADVLVFVILVIVLLVRPSGLLGSTKVEKV